MKKATDSGVCGKRLPKTIITGRVCCGWSKNIIVIIIVHIEILITGGCR